MPEHQTNEFIDETKLSPGFHSHTDRPAIYHRANHLFWTERTVKIGFFYTKHSAIHLF